MWKKGDYIWQRSKTQGWGILYVMLLAYIVIWEQDHQSKGNIQNYNCQPNKPPVFIYNRQYHFRGTVDAWTPFS